MEDGILNQINKDSEPFEYKKLTLAMIENALNQMQGGALIDREYRYTDKYGVYWDNWID